MSRSIGNQREKQNPGRKPKGQEQKTSGNQGTNHQTKTRPVLRLQESVAKALNIVKLPRAIEKSEDTDELHKPT